jgi:hypothetical protein
LPIETVCTYKPEGAAMYIEDEDIEKVVVLSNN